MQPSRIVLLVTLLLVLLVVTIVALQDSRKASAGSVRGPDSSEAHANAEGVGDEVLGESMEAVDEATDLITKRLLLFVAGGIAAAILILSFVIPWIGDSIGAFFYSPEEEIEPDPSALAVAKIAQGDYEGAIAEYRKLIETDPNDRFPIVEVAKLYLEKLNDPDRAVDFLEESLNDKEWPVDDAAYLMFRTVDIELTERDNPMRAHELLTLIVENFEGTRHAANAQHRIDEIDAGTWATNE